MLELAIRSLKLHNDIDIAVICDRLFLDECKQKLGNNILFFIQDDSKTGVEASINKLKIFDMPFIEKYDRIIFIDSDILLHTSVLSILDKVIEPGVLYAYSETDNYDSHNHIFWSLKDYSQYEIETFRKNKVLPFNAGCFAFVRCNEMKEHFKNILDMIASHKGEYFYEQSFMNVYFNRNGKSDRNVITDENYIMHGVLSSKSVYQGKVVHFAGNPGDGGTKFEKMNAYFSKYLKDSTLKIFNTRNEMIESLVRKHGTYAEIGVFEGKFSDTLCNILLPKYLVLIDLFEGVCGSGDQDGNNFSYANLGDTYSKLCKQSKVYPDMLKIMKGDSSKMLGEFSDNTFDMIYIDGDHSYEGVKRDIEVSYFKTKPGGLIMGHDYEMNMDKAKTSYDFGVKAAVDEFCEKYKQKIIAKGMDGCVSYAIIKDINLC
jgi:hypothetical protein